MSELYVVCMVNESGEVVGFPKGGGSSSPSFIRAFENKASAKRSAKRLNYSPVNTKVMRVKEFEEAL